MLLKTQEVRNKFRGEIDTQMCQPQRAISLSTQSCFKSSTSAQEAANSGRRFGKASLDDKTKIWADFFTPFTKFFALLAAPKYSSITQF